MLLQDYLALISWQGCKISLKDFENLESFDIKSPQEIASIVSHPETRSFLIDNKDWWKQAEKDYKDCGKKSYHILWPGHKDYPKAFMRSLSSPPVLTYIGQLNPHLDPITFVGSRKSDQRSLDWMDFYLSESLKDKNVSIVSGGARGIDQKAHLIAIQSKIPTICFLPSGLDCFYPSSLQSYEKDILDQGGAFISCFPPNSQMYKSYFHVRNRLIASYSKLVVVIQAQIRSGTMLTAKQALNFGVPVATLPGFPLSNAFSGNLQLLYDGAFLLRDHIDLSLLIETSVMGNGQNRSDHLQEKQIVLQ